MSLLHRDALIRISMKKGNVGASVNKPQKPVMGVKQGQNALSSLAEADYLIATLRAKHLPEIPYLFSVPNKNTRPPVHSYDVEKTPFELYEFPYLQYMTLNRGAYRGIGIATGGWHEDFEANHAAESPSVPSSTATPNPKDKKPSVKMSISDYKNMKQTGIKPVPKPTTAPDAQSGLRYARTVSAASADIPRLPSAVDSAAKSNGWARDTVKTRPEQKAAAAVREEKPTGPILQPKVAENPASQPGLASGHLGNVIPDSTVNGAARLAARGHTQENIPLRSEDTIAKGSAHLKNRSKEIAKHKLPPRPQSPRPVLENKSQKRPREQETSQPEKRAKVDRPSSPPRSDDKPTSAKPSIVLKPAVRPPRAIHGASNSLKPADPKQTVVKPAAKRPPTNDLPPLLSPLPMDLGVSTPSKAPDSLSNGINGKISKFNKTLPSAPEKPNGTTIQEIKKSIAPKPNHPDSLVSTRSELPPLLSPTLPDVVEQALAEYRRNDKVRQVTLELLRKPKVGHPPPKRKSDESGSTIESRSRDVFKGTNSASKVVKLSYKKRQAKDIERILNIRPQQSKQFKKYEEERLARLSRIGNVTSSPAGKRLAPESEDDMPSSSKGAKNPKKRFVDDRIPEPAPKRAKVPRNIDIVKASTPCQPSFISPIGTAPTPSKSQASHNRGEAVKGVTMRRIDPSESHIASTPQPALTSNPASAERPRVNSEDHHLNADFAKYNTLARERKRAMDLILKAPTADLTPKRNKKAICHGIESVSAYMVAFQAQDRYNNKRGRRDEKNWETILPLCDFVDHVSKGSGDEVLRGITASLCALCYEEVLKLTLECTSKSEPKGVLEKVGRYVTAKDKLWIAAESSTRRLEGIVDRKGMSAFGISALGPWCTHMRDAGRWAIMVLESLEAREKYGWVKEVDL